MASLDLSTFVWGPPMAEHGTVEYATAKGNDYREHEDTYALFLGLAKWGTISVIVVLVLMWFFLV